MKGHALLLSLVFVGVGYVLYPFVIAPLRDSGVVAAEKVKANDEGGVRPVELQGAEVEAGEVVNSKEDMKPILEEEKEVSI